MRIRLAAAATAACLLIGGCSSGSSSNNPGIGPTNPAANNGSGSIPATVTGVGSFKALFVAGGGIFPYPTDLYFNGSNDGTLNIPATTVFPGRVTMNQLDGFSTTASSIFRFSQPVKNDATMLNSNVRVVEMIMLRQSSGVYAPVATSPLRGANPILVPGVDYNVRIAPETDTGGTEVEIQWLKPLNASAGVYCPAPLPGTAVCGIGYVVLVTNGMLNTSNVAATPDNDFMTIRNEVILELGRAAAAAPATYSPTCPGITNATLNSICRLTYAQIGTGAKLPAPATVNPTSVIVSYSFTTQSTRDSLVALAADNTAQAITTVPTGLTTAGALIAAGLPATPLCPASPANTGGCGDVLAGSLTIPYFMTPPSAGDPTAPISKYWTARGASSVPGIATTSRDITRFNPLPAKVADLTIPMLIFKPNAASGYGTKPEGGWPVIVFMHGLRGDRTNALPIADSYTKNGFVVIAIDQWMHGITSTTSPLYASGTSPLYPAGTRERTFDVDFQNNTTGASGPDGKIDGSGAWFINIAHQQAGGSTTGTVLVSRDGAKQTGSDLITLIKSLEAGNLNIDGVEGGDINPARIHYAGISLGGIIGSACVCSSVQSFYLNVPGGTWSEIGRTSPSFAPTINAGLAAANPLLVPTAALYAQYFRELQAGLDSIDPTNYIGRLARDRPVVITKVINDRVVPNNTNDYLIKASGATRVSGPSASFQAVGPGNPRYVTFLSNQPMPPTATSAGLGPTHSSLLDPTGSLAATMEMQQHAVTLALYGGTGFVVGDSSLLQQP